MRIRLRPKLVRRLVVLAIAAMVLALFGTNALAQDEVALATQASVDTTWVLLTGFLVFFMQCGFAMLETGLIRQTSAVNALLENFIDAGVTAVAFWAVGFGIAFGTSAGGLIGTSNFFLSDAIIIADGSVTFAKFGAYPNLDVLTMFFFQFAFAAVSYTHLCGMVAPCSYRSMPISSPLAEMRSTPSALMTRNSTYEVRPMKTNTAPAPSA